MAALLNSLSFAFTNSILPKYRVKYYDYIIIIIIIIIILFISYIIVQQQDVVSKKHQKYKTWCGLQKWCSGI